MTEKKTPIYRIIFHNQGKIYEIYTNEVSQDGLYGFIEIGKLIFGENSSVVVDPAEENLKSEFSGVERSYIPMHSVIRIDQVSKKGTTRITEGSTEGNVMPFPVYSSHNKDKK